MTFVWRSYLQLAEELLDCRRASAVPQACVRSSISRAYYAVFCTARNVLFARGENVPRKDTHKSVRRRYDIGDKREKKIADSLRRLWSHRKDADYEDVPKPAINANTAKLALAMAKKALSQLESLAIR